MHISDCHRVDSSRDRIVRSVIFYQALLCHYALYSHSSTSGTNIKENLLTATICSRHRINRSSANCHFYNHLRHIARGPFVGAAPWNVLERHRIRHGSLARNTVVGRQRLQSTRRPLYAGRVFPLPARPPARPHSSIASPDRSRAYVIRSSEQLTCVTRDDDVDAPHLLQQMSLCGARVGGRLHVDKFCHIVAGINYQALTSTTVGIGCRCHAVLLSASLRSRHSVALKVVIIKSRCLDQVRKTHRFRTCLFLDKWLQTFDGTCVIYK